MLKTKERIIKKISHSPQSISGSPNYVARTKNQAFDEPMQKSIYYIHSLTALQFQDKPTISLASRD
jgi:hypothetical protein